MSHRVNVLLEDEIWAALRELPRGQRTRAVNDALSDWLRLRRRSGTVERVRRRRNELPRAVGASEEWIRADRDSH